MECSNCGRNAKCFCYECSKPLCGSCRRGKPLGWCRTCRDTETLTQALAVAGLFIGGMMWLNNKLTTSNQPQGNNKW